MSSSGQGGGSHIAGEMFMQMAGVRFVHIPYKGTGPSLVDLLGGHVSLTFAGVTSTKPLMAAGKLRGLAVTTARRSAAVPDLPTIAEAGVPGYATNTWNSLVVPRGTSRAIVDTLNEVIVTGFKRAQVRGRLREQGADPEAGTPEQLAAHIRAETQRLAQVVKLAGLKPR
jgi:tripartite-type tricarboxylate transporter receptor subunit TctC